MVIESVRQICISSLAKERGDSKLWWEYIRAFYIACSERDITDKCASGALRTADIDEKKINQCISDSFSGSDYALDDNTLLRKERLDSINTGIFFSPMLVINN